jgi:hypothetical protein
MRLWALAKLVAPGTRIHTKIHTGSVESRILNRLTVALSRCFAPQFTPATSLGREETKPRRHREAPHMLKLLNLTSFGLRRNKPRRRQSSVSDGWRSKESVAGQDTCPTSGGTYEQDPRQAPKKSKSSSVRGTSPQLLRPINNFTGGATIRQLTMTAITAVPQTLVVAAFVVGRRRDFNVSQVRIR